MVRNLAVDHWRSLKSFVKGKQVIVSEEIAESVEEAIEAVVPGGLQCGSGTHADGGYCVADDQSFELATESSSMKDLLLGASIVFGIAVAIIIVLRLIGRASRN